MDGQKQNYKSPWRQDPTGRPEMKSPLRTDASVFKGTRLIVPKSLRPEMLRQIHKSHLGIVKFRQRARELLFWPGMSVEIEQMVNNCSVCAEYAGNQPSDPPKPSVPPSLPGKKIGTDLIEFRGEHYFLSVCYRSKLIEVSKKWNCDRRVKKAIWSPWISAEVVLDNGPQFSSSEFE